MKNPLHRKKLQLAIKSVSNKQGEKSAELDFIWVTRRFPTFTPASSRRLVLTLTLFSPRGPTGWLDDIGLPQYKDQFNDGRVDGQMLQYLTVVSSEVSPAGSEQRDRVCEKRLNPSSSSSPRSPPVSLLVRLVPSAERPAVPQSEQPAAPPQHQVRHPRPPRQQVPPELSETQAQQRGNVCVCV